MTEESGARLKDWLTSQIGSGRLFSNETQWADKAGLSSSTFNGIRKRGTGSFENLSKIARAAGRNPIDILELADVLTPAEVQELKSGAPLQGPLDAEGREMLEILEVVPRGAPRMLFLSQTRKLAESFRDLGRAGLSLSRSREQSR